MEYYLSVVIALSLTVVSLIQWKRSQIRQFGLSERKEWFHTYSVLALNINGEIANALWHHDPWLSQVNQDEFAWQFLRWCSNELHLPRYGPKSPTHYFTITDYGNLNVFVNVSDNSVHIVLQDQMMHVVFWIWRANGVFEFHRRRSWTTGQSAPEQQWTSFHAFRTHLLKTTEEFVKNKGIQ